jgi:hypothetical protein
MGYPQTGGGVCGVCDVRRRARRHHQVPMGYPQTGEACVLLTKQQLECVDNKNGQ